MNIYWLIYLSGVIVSLYYMTIDHIEWCVKRKIDYKEEFRTFEVPFEIAVCSMCSWITVAVLYFTKKKE